ncbi:MAG TPA: SAM-dependent methyltransferase [Burkholderiaceae bacterium]|nr:SAM-dependent methyltransferase [Burkholderiaceae bacterium]
MPTLAPPSDHARAISQTLASRIAQSLQASQGFLRFDDYMRLALYEPGLGYYAGGAHKFGHFSTDGSDFVTAPELSPLFARALAVQVHEILELSEANVVMEFGAGTGALAAGLLNALDDQCARYRIVELSASLREQQREIIGKHAAAHAHKVEWLDALPERFSGCIVGNEVLDAMPIRIAHKTSNVTRERGVMLATAPTDEHPFEWQERDADAALLASIQQKGIDVDTLPNGYLVELHDEAEAFTSTIARMLERGAAVFIDYGFPAAEYYHPQRTQGTLMCHYRHHAIDDPLRWPGLQDITAHVDFSGIARAAEDTGATLVGYTSQARFLMNCGVLDELSKVGVPGSTEYLRAANAALRLMSEAEMGELFKVIAISRGIEVDLVGFSRGDRRASL